MWETFRASGAEFFEAGAQMSEVRREEFQKAVVCVRGRGKRKSQRFVLSDRNVPDGNLLAGLTEKIQEAACWIQN